MNRRPIETTIRTHASEPATEAESISRQLREVRSQWASGVAILAVSDGEDLEAITVTAFNTVSLDPPLVLACLDEQSAILPMLLEEGRFTVNVLPENAQRTASMVAGRMPLRDLPLARDGDPLLEGALVSLVCRLWSAYPGGDHRIVVGGADRARSERGTPAVLQSRVPRSSLGVESGAGWHRQGAAQTLWYFSRIAVLGTH
jgi:flavin reductase (NADH)